MNSVGVAFGLKLNKYIRNTFFTETGNKVLKFAKLRHLVPLDQVTGLRAALEKECLVQIALETFSRVGDKYNVK